MIVTKIDRVILVGKQEYAEQRTVFKSPLRNHELILHLSGRSTITFNGIVMPCEANTLRYLPKGENRGYVVERAEHGDCIDICFDTDVPLAETAFAQKLQNGPVVSALFKKIFSIWVSKNEGYYYKCIALLYEILSELQTQNYLPERQYRVLQPAVEYINEHFLEQKISVPQLAEDCGISESYLKKLFHKKFGISPLQYSIRLRINHACDLLRTEQYTVAEVAELCGYANPHFFSRQFKEYMGITPTDFMKKYKSSK